MIPVIMDHELNNPRAYHLIFFDYSCPPRGGEAIARGSNIVFSCPSFDSEERALRLRLDEQAGWIPAFAGMTDKEAGMTDKEAGMTASE